ncbi:putative leader peptide [Planotetraspora sp. GP83]
MVRSALLTSRDHIDLCRMSSALCRLRSRLLKSSLKSSD